MAPRNVDYSKTVIYKLCCNDISITDIYIGHTTDFTRRKSQHKSSCNNENSEKYNYNVYQFIRENGCWNNWQMVVIEKYPCNDGNEAKARERFWLEKLQATLNSCIPGRTQQEYNAQYREQNSEKIKEYREQNKEQKKEYDKQYNQANKEKRKELQTQYYQENVETIKECAKQYREQNSEKIKERANTQFKCECGGKFTFSGKSQHMKTQKHQNFINNN